jgi:hypothetical protein
MHDVRKNFASIEFRQHAKSLVINVKEMPVETYNSVGKIERYHGFLRRAYKIIYNKLRDTKTSTEMSLQMAVKTVNDSAGPDGIIPTLLVFGAYPRITNNSVLSLITTKRAEAIRKASNEVRRYYAKRHVEDVFRIRNSPDITVIFKLPIQSDVKV